MLDSRSQLEVYAQVRSAGERVRALDSLIEWFTRECVRGGEQARPDLVARLGEIRWQLEQLTASADAIAQRLGAPLGAKSRADDPGVVDAVAVLRGSTAVFSIADLFSTLTTHGKTGSLTVQGDGHVFVFELEQGRIVHAVTSDDDPAIRLGTILVELGMMEQAALERELAASVAAGSMLGAHLVAKGVLSAEQMREALASQVRAIFQKAFDLERAEFRFCAGAFGGLAQRAELNVNELLLDAARRADERARVSASALPGSEMLGAIDAVLGG